MGLDISHDAFSGAYSAFNRLRQVIAKAMGGSYPPHEDTSLNYTRWYWGPGYNEETNPGLAEFFRHSDCDGEISPEKCLLLADELEKLIPLIGKQGLATGHLARDGGYVAVTRRLIDGCREACSNNEPLEFA